MIFRRMLQLAIPLFVAGGARHAAAQQLEPRAYSPAPTGTNFVGVTALHSSGDVLFDATSPFSDVRATIQAVAPFYARTFDLCGRSSSVALLVPYSWGFVEGNVGEQFRRAERSGFADAMFRFAMNFLGNPPVPPQEFLQQKPRTTLGASVTMTVPSGEYRGTKLINLGTNRWSFKPELGLAKPLGRWWLEVYGGAWLFTSNDSYYGGQTRRQDPLGVVQGHVIYVVRPGGMWVSLDATYYWGGETSLDGVSRDDRQENSRIGSVLAVPLTRAQSLKFAYARGATGRLGSNLDTFGVTWQYRWFDHPPAPAQ